MNTTTNYNLKKPGYEDTADITVLNENMDIIDAAIKGIKDNADGHYMKQINSTVAASAWQASTYDEWPYKADVTFEECTAEYVCDVMFSSEQIALGIFAPFAEASTGKVTIYAEDVPAAAITIPIIELRK